MRVWSKTESYISLAGAVAIAVVAGITLWRIAHNFYLLPLMLPVSAFFYYMNMRKYIRRRNWTREPFPPEWRSMLQESVRFYSRLPEAEKTRFETDVRIFLNENEITGVETTVDDRLRLLVAASAVILLFGRPDWEYHRLPSILIYPRSFDEEYSFDSIRKQRTLAGIVVPQQAIVVARDQLLEAYSGDPGPYNVAIHEFAHALDMVEGRAEGMPRDLNSRMMKQWYRLIRDQLELVRQGRSILDPYAGKNRAELFAVAVEHFFGRPDELKEALPDLYAALASFFDQDPARVRYLN